jgi:hypothetical protein
MKEEKMKFISKIIGGQQIMSILLTAFVLSALPISLEGFTKDFLIWDPDGTKTSGPVINTTLLGLGYSGDYSTTLPGNLSDYRSIWICLGVSFDNYSLNNSEGDQLVAYLNGQDSTNIYMEGADTWMIDPPTSVHSYFHITGIRNGWGDTDEILGQAGTFTQGMTFNYTGENAFMDQIDPDAFSFAIFADTNSNVADFDYFNGVVYDNGSCTYKTVGVSFEFGGLTPASGRIVLAESIMAFFCIPRPSFQWDVAPLTINAPRTYVPPNWVLNPIVTVQNFGTSPVSFNVHCEISPPLWIATPQPVALGPGASLQVSFTDNWTSSSTKGATHTVTVYTDLGADQNRGNDTLSKQVIVWDDRWYIQSRYTNTPPVADGSIGASEWQDAEIRDVSDFLGKVGSSEPPNSAFLYVMNDDTTLYLALDAFADGSFTAPGDIFDLYFEDNHDGNWPPQPDSSEGELMMNVNSPPQNVLFDFRPMFDGFPGVPHQVNTDGWVETTSGHMQYEIVLPLGAQYPDYNLNASPCDTVGFWLAAADYGSMTGYAWWPTSSSVGNGILNDMGDLILACTPPIDTLHDGMVDTLINPPGFPDSLCINAPYRPQARIRNTGNQLETSFLAICEVRGANVYIDTVTVPSLAPDSTTIILFTPWNPVTPSIDTMTVCVEVPNDTINANDCSSLVVKTYDCLVGIGEDPTPFLTPKAFGLYQSMPNPSASSTTIRYDLPVVSRVRIVVYDITGRVVKVLVDEAEEAGYRSIVWDGRDSGGRDVTSGVYFYKLTSRTNSLKKDFTATRKLILLR